MSEEKYPRKLVKPEEEVKGFKGHNYLPTHGERTEVSFPLTNAIFKMEDELGKKGIHFDTGAFLAGEQSRDWKLDIIDNATPMEVINWVKKHHPKLYKKMSVHSNPWEVDDLEDYKPDPKRRPVKSYGGLLVSGQIGLKNTAVSPRQLVCANRHLYPQGQKVFTKAGKFICPTCGTEMK